MINTAASQLTKTAITVTAIFVVALGYDLWYYILAYSDLTEYKINTPLQKIGMLVHCLKYKDLVIVSELSKEQAGKVYCLRLLNALTQKLHYL